MLRDEIANLGPVKVKDVEDAQLAITNTAKELAQRGEIDINTAGDERIIE